MLDQFGHGGQILLSLGTEELVGDSPLGLSLRDLGEHTLKDLGRPERIYQVVHPNLRDDFPDLLSLDAFPNNLPIQLTSFVGRDLELLIGDAIEINHRTLGAFAAGFRLACCALRIPTAFPQ